MADYESLKATELKALLKERKIAATGLTKKAQFIQALVAADEQAATQTVPDASEDVPPVVEAADQAGEAAQEEVPQPVVEEAGEAAQEEVPQPEAHEAQTEPPQTEGTQTGSVDEGIAEPQTEPSQAEETQAVSIEEGGAEPQPEPSQVEQTQIDAVEEGHAESTVLEEQQAGAARPEALHAIEGQNMQVDEDAPKDGPSEEKEQDPEPASPERKRKRSVSDVEEEDIASAKKTKTQDTGHGGEQEQKDVEMTDKPADMTTDKTAAAPDLSTLPPSEHPPTAAIYIKNLMRPLQAQAFREDLLSLTNQTGAQGDTAIVELHLDVLKTHAFVLCSSTTLATTLRNELHDRPWPQHESQRRSLWVDFIPENSVQTWIDEEKRAGRDARFEVTYARDQSGQQTATLSEVNAQPTIPQDRFSGPGQGVAGAPSGPRAARPTRQSPPRAPKEAVAPKQQSSSFNKLDAYFRSTTAKPKIYYQPVDKELASRRLEEIDRETSRDWHRGKSWNRSAKLAPIDQLRRYTYEDGDKIVDGGVDFGGFGRRQGAGGSGGYNPNAPRGGRGGGGGGPRRYRP